MLVVFAGLAAAAVFRVVVEPTLPWLVLAGVAAYVVAEGLPSAWRLLKSPPGTLKLDRNGITVEDLTLFSQPFAIPREVVADTEVPPSGRLVFRVGGAAARVNAALASVVAVRPNLLVRFVSPQVMTAARRNQLLVANFALRPPKPRRRTGGLWFQLADDRDVQRVIDWISRA